MKTHKKYYLRTFAAAFKKLPWLVTFARLFWRMPQPRFTVGVVGVVFNPQGEVLLVEHIFHPKTPWGLPGGWINKNESPAAAVIREFAEELGVEIAIMQVLLVDLSHRHHLDVAFLCQQESEITRLNRELLDYGWFKIDALPQVQRFHRQAIQCGAEAWQKMTKVL